MLLQKFGNQEINCYFCSMKITITLHCPDCQGTKIKKDGKKAFNKQNYFCKDCSRQFIGDHALTNKCIGMKYWK